MTGHINTLELVGECDMFFGVGTCNIKTDLSVNDDLNNTDKFIGDGLIVEQRHLDVVKHSLELLEYAYHELTITVAAHHAKQFG